MRANEQNAAANQASLTLAAVLADLWHTIAKDLFGSYRPERHYMRGPGPRYAAKSTGNPASGVRIAA